MNKEITYDSMREMWKTPHFNDYPATEKLAFAIMEAIQMDSNIEQAMIRADWEKRGRLFDVLRMLIDNQEILNFPIPKDTRKSEYGHLAELWIALDIPI